MRARIVVLAQITPLDVERWTDLVARSIEPYPFLDPRLLLPAARHRETARSMRFVFIEDGSDLLLVMPFVLRRGPAGLPVRMVSTRGAFLDSESGWDHPLIDADRAAEALEGLVVNLRSLELPGLLEFTNFPAEGPLAAALTAVAASLNLPVLERDRVDFSYARAIEDGSEAAAPGISEPASFTASHVSANSRKKHSRFARGLAEAVGAELRIEDRGQDADAIEQFIELQAAGWKGDPSRDGSGLRVMGYGPWFSEVAAAYRADGDLAVYALTGGGQIIHMYVVLRVGDAMFGYADAYDERFASFHAGTLGRIATMNRALAEPGVQLFDPNFVARFVVEARRIFPHSRERTQLLTAYGSPASRILVQAIPAGRRLRARLRGGV